MVRYMVKVRVETELQSPAPFFTRDSPHDVFSISLSTSLQTCTQTLHHEPSECLRWRGRTQEEETGTVRSFCPAPQVGATHSPSRCPP